MRIYGSKSPVWGQRHPLLMSRRSDGVISVEKNGEI
jgi:hypothetical protein